MKCYFVISFLLCLKVCKGDPFSVVAAAIDYVTYDPCDGNNKCKLYVKESICPDTNLLEINLGGDLKLEFTAPTENVFNLTIKENKFLNLGVQLDYETGSQSATIKINDYFLNIYINNVNNKEPYFTEVQTSCTIKENIIFKDETCTYTVNDPDGWLEAPTIDLSPDVCNVFKFAITRKSAKERTFTLTTKKELDFESISLYSCVLSVSDGLFTTDANVLINVEDQPDEPPIWQKTYASKNVIEGEEITFDVSARDGDIGINADINYAIMCLDDIEVNIGTDNGTVNCKNGIDRDEFDKEIFQCTITAYEKENASSKIDQELAFIVQDVNNKWPEITFIENNENKDSITLKIFETSKAEIPTGFKINVNDRDTGDNARYDVKLDGSGPDKAFQIMPKSGYKDWNFSLNIINNAILDYDSGLKQFEIKVIATEITDNSRRREKSISVELIPWNDKKPEFDKSYSIEINETIGIDQDILTVTATDKDNDILEYDLLGTYINRILNIDSGTGRITTKLEKSLDYETMNVISFQVVATEADTEEHQKANVEVIINVIDVNDETPTITVYNNLNGIYENQEDGTPLEGIGINVDDADKDADLETIIDWNKSYFTKNGAVVIKDKITDYKECIELDTADVNKPKLRIKETVEGNTPDYELFDTIYLYITTTDKSQTYGLNNVTAIISITIKDINDNPPVFLRDTLTSSKKVIEKLKDTFVGFVLATDDDGEGNNDVSYTLTPRNGTPPDLIEIDRKSGQLRVISENIIANQPNGFTYLYYEVVASDGTLETKAEIEIFVIDQNDAEPKLCEQDCVPVSVAIEEKAKEGTLIAQIKATDDDRDPPYNVLRYTLDAPSKEIFRINPSNGKITVGPDGPTLLDRDRGKQSYTIRGVVYDNDGDSTNGILLSVSFEFGLNLTDINDQKPVIEQQLEPLRITQNINKDTVLTTIKVTDDDEQGNDNSHVSLRVVKIKPAFETTKDFDELFVIDDATKQSPAKFELKTGTNLECCYGNYEIEITARDHGLQFNEYSSVYKVHVEPYNFKKPNITYPAEGQEFLLSTIQNAQMKLNCFIHEDDCMEEFTATDDQGGKFDVTFSIDSSTNPDDLFDFRQDGGSRATLLLNNVNFKEFVMYNLNIIATTQGEPEKSTQRAIKVMFVDPNPYPLFNESDRHREIGIHECSVNFVFSLPNAGYPFDYDIPGFKKDVFYRIESVDPEVYTKNFNIGDRLNRIQLVKELDRESYEKVTFDVVASRISSGTIVNDKSKMSVLVNIIDDNDNEPVFNETYYSAIIMASYDNGQFLTVITAHDPDVSDVLEWKEIDAKPFGEGIENVKDPFRLKATDGSITLNFKVQNSMSGYFDYTVAVTDKVHDIQTTVKIYIVTDDNRLEIQFENPIKSIEDLKDKIAEIMSANTGYVCKIESIQKGTDENGKQVDSYTNVRMYFLDPETSKPMPRNVMQAKLTALSTYENLISALEQYKIKLKSLGDKESVTDDISDVLKTWLIAVSVALGAFSIISWIVLIIKIRSLKNRLNKLTVTKFGSQESGLNRIAAPGTNMRTTEGANPVYNTGDVEKLPEFDRQSIQSNDSELIGVENNENFNLDDFAPRRESLNPALFQSEDY